MGLRVGCIIGDFNVCGEKVEGFFVVFIFIFVGILVFVFVVSVYG